MVGHAAQVAWPFLFRHNGNRITVAVPPLGPPCPRPKRPEMLRPRHPRNSVQRIDAQTLQRRKMILGNFWERTCFFEDLLQVFDLGAAFMQRERGFFGISRILAIADGLGRDSRRRTKFKSLLVNVQIFQSIPASRQKCAAQYQEQEGRLPAGHGLQSFPSVDLRKRRVRWRVRPVRQEGL